MDTAAIMNIERATKEILLYIGEDVEREGLLETPRRYALALREMLGGYRDKPESVFKVFESGDYDEMVVVRDIEFVSMCEHHMLPFAGVAHFAYLPNHQIIGLSKIARLVDIFAKRLQVQENLTKQVVEFFVAGMPGPVKGAACVIEARHLCLACRGAKKQNAIMVTSALYGAFKDDPSTRAEFMRLLGR